MRIIVIALLVIAVPLLGIAGLLYWLAPETPESANVAPPPVESVLASDPGRVFR